MQRKIGELEHELTVVGRLESPLQHAVLLELALGLVDNMVVVGDLQGLAALDHERNRVLLGLGSGTRLSGSLGLTVFGCLHLLPVELLRVEVHDLVALVQNVVIVEALRVALTLPGEFLVEGLRVEGKHVLISGRQKQVGSGS